jgi:hypothetical protein
LSLQSDLSITHLFSQNTTQHNTTQHNTTQHNTTQHNTTQHNTTQRSTTQHNTTQYNTTHHTSNTLTPLLPPQSGQMHAMQGDWSKAVSSYRRSLEGFEAVCGKKDKKIAEVSRLLKVRRNIIFMLSTFA